MDALQRLRQRLKQLFGFGTASIVDDTGDQQVIQVQIFVGGDADLEQVIDQVTRLGEYGFFSVPPKGAEVAMLFPGGNRSSGLIVATGHRATRMKGGLPGESGIYNGLTGAFIRLSADGKIRSSGDWIHEGSFKATGEGTFNGDHTVSQHTHTQPNDGHGDVEAATDKPTG